MQTTIAYNEQEIKEKGSIEDIKQGYSIWVDLVDPTRAEIGRMQELFSLDAKAVETTLNKSKKPQVRILEDHTYTIILGIKYKVKLLLLQVQIVITGYSLPYSVNFRYDAFVPRDIYSSNKILKLIKYFIRKPKAIEDLVNHVSTLLG